MNEENATTQITKKKIDETKNSSKNLKESTNKPNKLDSSNAKSMKETSFQKSNLIYSKFRPPQESIRPKVQQHEVNLLI